MTAPKLLNTVWLMHTADGFFYPITPSEKCKPSDHGELNPHVTKITDAEGKTIWERVLQ